MANPIQTENAKAGTSDWKLTNPALLREVEGYLSATSINRGETIDLYVSTSAANYSYKVYRFGWYGGLYAREVYASGSIGGTLQSMPTEDADGMFDCATVPWTAPQTISVPSDPADWTTGIYLVKLTASTGKQSWGIFVVRNDSSTSDYYYEQPVGTYNAYNQWGGKSSYLPSGTHAVKVSFNRPYVLPVEIRAKTGVGAGEFLTVFPSSASYGQAHECNLIAFVEKEGYDFSYSTNVDTHVQGNLILNHNVLVWAGHNEYLTKAARDAYAAVLPAGKHLRGFGHNTFYEQVRYENGNRTQVSYRDFYLSDPVQGPLTATQFRRAAYANLPEEALIGMAYFSSPVNNNIKVTNPSHPMFSGTGFTQDQILTGLLGNEAENTTVNSPAGIEILCSSPFGGGANAEMIFYTHASGGTLGNTGSGQWNWGLDDLNSEGYPGIGRPSFLSAGVQQATRNLLPYEPEESTPRGAASGRAVASGRTGASGRAAASGRVGVT